MLTLRKVKRGKGKEKIRIDFSPGIYYPMWEKPAGRGDPWISNGLIMKTSSSSKAKPF